MPGRSMTHMALSSPSIHPLAPSPSVTEESSARSGGFRMNSLRLVRHEIEDLFEGNWQRMEPPGLASGVDCVSETWEQRRDLARSWYRLDDLVLRTGVVASRRIPGHLGRPGDTLRVCRRCAAPETPRHPA